jgi:predicted Zn-dependent peptidase
VLLGKPDEPEEVLAGISAVTAEDVQRVAADVLGGRLHLALIGPFDDPARFEQLLAA